MRRLQPGLPRTFLVVVLGLGAACQRPNATATTVYTYSSPLWYEEIGRYFQVSPTGTQAIYGAGIET